ncbi:MAG: hypothetical protein HY583_02705 [Candidatus Omnitrophica bacterium]|nr:hypothetical protein [Candidatus Omnitrophota bacterium]
MTDSKSDRELSIPSTQKWYLRWWSVILWLAILGPFGLPFLWKSKDFNLFLKWFLTLAIIVVTVVCVWGSWKVVQVTIEQFRASGLI